MLSTMYRDRSEGDYGVVTVPNVITILRLLLVPGVIYARRYRVHEGASKYTTVYEFTSTAVPESAEWKHQNQHSSPRSPRMRQAMTHAPGSPGVYTRMDPS